MKHINNKNIILLLFVLLTMACSDELDKILPRNQIPQENLTSGDIQKVLNGVYSKMESLAFKFWFENDLKGENFKAGPGGNLTDPVSMTPENSAILSIWQTAYTSLSEVNFLLESYEGLTAKENYANLGCAAYYFRALIYYNLATRWGGVPIVRQRTYNVVPISPEADVWDFVIEDIEKALSLNTTATDRFYVSKAAVQALAARIYLAVGDMTNANIMAQNVISMSSYELASNSVEFGLPYASGTTSKEVIFAFANKRSSSYLNFVGYVNDVDASWNYAPATDQYNSLFADDMSTNRTGDIRYNATFHSSDPNRLIKLPNGIEGYQIITTENYANTPIVVSRIAEMYLISAEAQGKQNGATVLVEFLKKRYETYPTIAQIQAMSDSDFQSLTLNERRREFFGEGYFWYDVKRTGRTDMLKTLNGRNHLMYYPIPQNEIDLAGKENYPQNPGYN